jgi:hypothetical protein
MGEAPYRTAAPLESYAVNPRALASRRRWRRATAAILAFAIAEFGIASALVATHVVLAFAIVIFAFPSTIWVAQQCGRSC